MIRPFLFWCNKILPLVYDDSISYYELLCKLYAYLTKLTEKVNQHSDAINALNDALIKLEEYVNEYFNSPQFYEELQDALDDMFSDGTLGELIMNIANVTQFVDDKSRRDAYKADVCETIASYLENMNYCQCLVGGAKNTGGVKMVGKYDESHGYTQLLTVAPNRFETPTVEIDGENYKVMNSDCTTWVSILTKCMKYIDSPYFAKFLGTTDNASLLQRALDTNVLKDYTFDFLNHWVQTAAFADSTGGRLRNIFYNREGETSIDASVLATLETGDIIFFGSSEFSSRFLGIHHCGIFVKTLDEIDTYLTDGRTCKTMGDDGHSDNGYVVHWSTGHGYSTDTYVDHLRINTIEGAFGYDDTVSNTWHGVYASRISASVLNSAKQLRRTVGISAMYDRFVLDAPTRPTDCDDTFINLQSGFVNLPYANVGLYGANLPQNTDLNDIVENGCWRNKYSNWTFPHHPDSNYPLFFLMVYASGFGIEGANESTILFQQLVATDTAKTTVKMWIRAGGLEPGQGQTYQFTPWILQTPNLQIPAVGENDKNKYLHTNSSTGDLEWNTIE